MSWEEHGTELGSEINNNIYSDHLIYYQTITTQHKEIRKYETIFQIFPPKLRDIHRKLEQVLMQKPGPICCHCNGHRRFLRSVDSGAETKKIVRILRTQIYTTTVVLKRIKIVQILITHIVLTTHRFGLSMLPMKS